jgi:hypothetical protein
LLTIYPLSSHLQITKNHGESRILHPACGHEHVSFLCHHRLCSEGRFFLQAVQQRDHHGLGTNTTFKQHTNKQTNKQTNTHTQEHIHKCTHYMHAHTYIHIQWSGALMAMYRALTHPSAQGHSVQWQFWQVHGYTHTQVTH